MSYDHGKSWMLHDSVQSGWYMEDFGRAEKLRDQYRKPVVSDEVVYGGDIPEGWGNLSARRWCTGSG